ncbi:LIPASE-LIKE PAD4 [Salix purpurea]|uniref:LIPASE-LIKE PAD4 n=1 Tax=Salix purpurea TaxID=77065 RepID=A0A9Q0V393_SALPP|nr:LIPASE-LIKE PAD4 [Salix purpurea]
MDTESSTFETTEMLADFLASTPLLSESWRLCNLANQNSPVGFVANQVGSIGYLAFSGTLFVSGSDPSFKNLVCLTVRDGAGNDLFAPLHDKNEGEEPVMVQGALLRIFENMYSNPSFQYQVSFLPW